MIDGCNWWQAFVRISLPIARPGLVSAVIFTFALSWNEFMMSKLIITKPAMVTFQVSLYNMMATYVEKRSRYDPFERSGADGPGARPRHIRDIPEGLHRGHYRGFHQVTPVKLR